VVTSILPIVAAGNDVQVRRWGADFLAEALASPAVPIRAKEDLALKTIETLKSLVEEQNLDTYILKSIIMASASIYPLMMRWM
jgi:symplekin